MGWSSALPVKRMALGDLEMVERRANTIALGMLRALRAKLSFSLAWQLSGPTPPSGTAAGHPVPLTC
jgi:hypothetical protein